MIDYGNFFKEAQTQHGCRWEDHQTACCVDCACMDTALTDYASWLLDHKPSDDQALRAVRTLIAWIGDDPMRPGLQDTPQRVLRAWRDAWGQGYSAAPSNIVRLFDREHEGADEIVVLRGVQFHSHCEHHMAPFSGTMDIGYIPGSRGVLGLSKLARIVEHHARRLQVQERLTAQVADYIAEHVSPDVGVIARAVHTCMTSRGVRQPNTQTVTSAIRGKFFDDPTVRAEFLHLATP